MEHHGHICNTVCEEKKGEAKTHFELQIDIR